MTTVQSRRPIKVADRWPTALGAVCVAGALGVIALLDNEVDLFGPVVVTMAGIYVMAYALDRQRAAWVALAVLTAILAVLHVLRQTGVLPVEPAVGMSVVVVLLWLWAVARRQLTDRGVFVLQTAGMVGFGAVTLVCAALAPRWGMVLAGAGFLAHAAWDGYHFRVDKVVDRPYAEFCGVVDLVVGPALIVAALI